MQIIQAVYTSGKQCWIGTDCLVSKSFIWGQGSVRELGRGDSRVALCVWKGTEFFTLQW